MATQDIRKKAASDEAIRSGKRNLQSILTVLLCQCDIQGFKVRLRFVPGASGLRLKHSAQFGTLSGFSRGYFLKVIPDGCSQPQVYHPRFWEVLVP